MPDFIVSLNMVCVWMDGVCVDGWCVWMDDASLSVCKGGNELISGSN